MLFTRVAGCVKRCSKINISEICRSNWRISILTGMAGRRGIPRFCSRRTCLNQFSTKDLTCRKFSSKVVGAGTADPNQSLSSEGSSREDPGSPEPVPEPSNAKKKQTVTYPLTTLITETLTRHPEKLSRSLKSPDGIYILHNEIIDYLIKYIGSDLTKDDLLIIEPNAGPGILTQRLLDAGVKNLRITEDKKTFLPHLQQLVDCHADRLTLVEADLFNLSRLAYIDRVTLTTNLDNLFVGAPTKQWTDDPPILVLGILPTRKERFFLPYLSMALSELNSIFSFGRSQFLFFISEEMYSVMKSSPEGLRKYRSFSVLSQLFFDIELLGKEPRSNFFPPQQRLVKNIKKFEFDEEYLHLVRLTPKKELMTLLPSSKQLPELAFFIRQHMVKRRKYIISTIESWIPRSGPRLIRNGYTIFMRFGDLTPLEFLQLFREFSSWPEYHDCSFRQAMFRALNDFDDEAD